ncbi:hypothetical protein IWQ61_001611 [Dispira simplex]|nr:hypothetical protein IWQ61_001611 [Dispira simplex]
MCFGVPHQDLGIWGQRGGASRTSLELLPGFGIQPILVHLLLHVVNALIGLGLKNGRRTLGATIYSYVVASIYSFAPTLVDHSKVQRIRDQLHTILDKWMATGRIYVAEEGINAQMAYPREREAQLHELLFSIPLFHPLRYEWNQSLDQTRGRNSFPDLRVKVKRQIVADGLVGPASVNLHQHWPEHLESDEFERQIRQLPGWKETLVLTDTSESHSTTPQLIDMRNQYESTIGYFVGATRLDCDTYQEAMHSLNDLTQSLDPTQPVLMYCTGGIRCTKAGAYLKSRGFASVKVLKGGITAYGRMVQERPSHPSLFVGKNFTFDARRGERISPAIVGRCHQCNSPCDTYTNCVNIACHQLMLQCPTCAECFQNTCGGSHCFPLDTQRSTPSYNYHRQVRPNSLVK